MLAAADLSVPVKEVSMVFEDRHEAAPARWLAGVRKFGVPRAEELPMGAAAAGFSYRNFGATTDAEVLHCLRPADPQRASS